MENSSSILLKKEEEEEKRRKKEGLLDWTHGAVWLNISLEVIPGIMSRRNVNTPLSLAARALRNT